MNRRAVGRPVSSFVAVTVLLLPLGWSEPGPALADPGLVQVPIDAASVDGYSASPAPESGRLLPLDPTARFPLQAIPQGPGSGLNADLLDGKTLSEILASPAGDVSCAGCVGPSDLAANAVSGSKIVDGSVALADLAFDPATQAELNSLASLGSINAGTNPMDWTKLKGVPSGIADGTDADTTYTAGDGLQLIGTTINVADDAVTGEMIADGRVGLLDLAFDPATQSELDVLAVAGTMNSAGNPLDWTKLKGVPSGIADGTDSDTTYTAGAGLVLAGATFSVGSGAVTGAMIADGQVGVTDLNFDPATQAELNSLATAGTINSAANPMDWTKLKGVPAGLADGVDDVSSGPATDVNCTGCVAVAELAFDPATQSELNSLAVAGTVNTATNPMDWSKLKGVPGPIADGSDAIDGGNAANLGCAACVDVAELAFDPATQAELNSLATAGTINAAANPIDWTKLKGVPAGLADGVDDVSSGPATDVDCTACVAVAELAFDPATQSELDLLGVAGTINTGTNPVDWTKVKGVPAGFADGVDNTGGTASGLSCVGCVNSTDIEDGSIATMDLGFDPATQGELDSLAAAGTINGGTNPMNWTKLQSVPFGFADGLDNAGNELPVFARTSLGVVGGHLAVAMGSDGFPFVAFGDGNDLRAVHCTNIACTVRDASVALDTTGNVGAYPSVTVGSDGFPFVTYYDDTADDLRAVHCTNVSCTSHDTPVPLDGAGNVGTYTSVTIGSDGFPFVTYIGSANLKAIHCLTPGCVSHDGPLVLSSSMAVGHTSVTVGSDGFAFVTYSEGGNIRAVHCTNVSCSTREDQLLDVVLGGAGALLYASVTVGSDGFPFATYYDDNNDDLKAVHCANVSCTTHDTPLVLDSAGVVGLHTSVTVGSDGFPFVTYEGGGLKAVHCTNPSCTTGDTPLVLDSLGGLLTSVTVGSDGFPFVAYGGGVLKALHCSSRTCVPYQRRR